MNVLSHEKQIEVIAALCEGLGVRAAARITGVNRGSVASLALRVGRGCATLHDRKMLGLHVTRLELDEVWGFVGRKRRRDEPMVGDFAKGDQYTYVALAASTRAIISYRTGKRIPEMTDDFIQDIRGRVIGSPEISTDGLHHYKGSIRDAFGSRVSHGVIRKTYSVTHLNVREASRRYSPAQVVAVTREVESGVPAHISTSYVERSHLTLRQTCKRFARLGNGYSKKLEQHCVAVSLHVMSYNFCRVHDSLKMTPAMALGIADRVWSVAELVDAALSTQPITPVTTAPDRRRRFKVIEGGKKED